MPEKINFFVIMGAAVRRDGSAGGAMRRRVETALGLGKQVPRPCYLATGGVGRYGPAEAEVMKGLLLQAGVPESTILLDNVSHDTLSSVMRCVHILGGYKDLASVTVCTDIYHQLRCRWLFYLMGIPTRKVQLPSGRTANGTFRWLYYYLREFLAIPFDTLLFLVKRPFSKKETT